MISFPEPLKEAVVYRVTSSFCDPSLP